MTKNNKRKKQDAGKGRQRRAGLLLAAMLLTVMAAGCFRKPSEPAVNPTAAPTMTTEPTAAVTPESTVTPTEAVTKKPTAKPTAAPTKAVTPEPTATATPEATGKPDATATPKPTVTETPTKAPAPTEAVTQKPTPKPTAKPTAEPTKAATPEPTKAVTPEPTAKPTAEPTPTPSGTAFTPSGTGGRVTFTGNTVEISKANVGDTVRFGSYEQDNDASNGKEVIEWLVLDKQDGKLLLLSKDALDAKPYNEEWVDVTWETCTLRGWLNGTFYTTAFSQTEQGRIATTKVRNEDNPDYGTGGGNDTEDKVFLLSIGEVLDYFDPDPYAEDPARRAKVTAYAKAQGGYVSSTSVYAGNGLWWLRSPGDDSDCAAEVNHYGYVHDGDYVYYVDFVVRPAFWLNLEDAAPSPTPTSAPTPTPSGTAFTPSGTGGRVTFTGNTVEVSEAKVGDTVRFGSYEQDNDASNGKEAVEWLVLDKQDGKLLLLSKYVLDAKPYNEELVGVTWETCTLRSWLNGTFYTTAFSQTEQGRIATTKVRNEDNPDYGTGGGNDTEDKVFLLSIGEVLDYFDPDPYAEDPVRRAKVTAYAEAQGGWVISDSDYAGNGWWWLRSPGGLSINAAFVRSTGYVSRGGDHVLHDDDVVRPAFWLNLES